MIDSPYDLQEFLRLRHHEEALPLEVKRMRPQHVCLHCGNAFEPAYGIVTDDGALCDVCNGD